MCNSGFGGFIDISRCERPDTYSENEKKTPNPNQNPNPNNISPTFSVCRKRHS